MKISILQATRTVIAILAIAASDLASASDEASGAGIPSVVGANEIMNLGASLVLIIIAILAVAWLYSRSQRIGHRDGDIIRILATQALGPKERVLLVEVAGKQLVLGMTAAQIQTLHVLEHPLESDPEVAAPMAFAERLRTAIIGVRT